MKKIITFLLVVITVCSLFVACSSKKQSSTTTSEIQTSTTESQTSTTLSSSNSGSVYYDRNGVAVNSEEEINYYSEDGTIYHYQMVEDYMPDYVNQTTGEHLNGFSCYIDENGFLYYDENNTLDIVSGTVDTYTDSNGKKYYHISTVSWDANGNLQHRAY